MTTGDDAGNFVGPVMRAGEIADAVLEAIQEESEGREVITEAHASYVRIKVADECFVRFETVGDVLGRTVTRGDIEATHAELRRLHSHRTGRHPVPGALGDKIVAVQVKRHEDMGAASPRKGGGRASTKSLPPTCRPARGTRTRPTSSRRRRCWG